MLFWKAGHSAKCIVDIWVAFYHIQLFSHNQWANSLRFTIKFALPTVFFHPSFSVSSLKTSSHHFLFGFIICFTPFPKLIIITLIHNLALKSEKHKITTLMIIC